MDFKSKHIRGAGRGKGLGFPTINLEIPDTFSLVPGIFAVWVIIDKNRYPAVLHYGTIPSFNDEKSHLEAHLLEKHFEDSLELIRDEIAVTTVKRLRGVKHFTDIQLLQKQIEVDIAQARLILGI